MVKRNEVKEERKEEVVQEGAAVVVQEEVRPQQMSVQDEAKMLQKIIVIMQQFRGGMLSANATITALREVKYKSDFAGQSFKELYVRGFSGFEKELCDLCVVMLDER